MEDINQRINDLLNWRIEAARTENAAIADAFSRCQSPIEQEFFLAYLHLSNPFPATEGTFIDRMDHVIPGAFTRIEIQSPVEIEDKRYRADFSFLVCVYDNERSETETVKRFIVETDGHDFHEKTKEQATRDKARDRAMARAGIQVVRFSGSEIHKSAIGAALETRSMLTAPLYSRIAA